METQGAASAFGGPGAASSSDGAGARLAASLAALSLAEAVPATPAAERRGHAAARGALTPVTPFSDADDAATPPPAAQQPPSPLLFSRVPSLSPQVAAEAAAFGARVAALRAGLTSQALLLHCPGCARPFGDLDFRNCLALSCGCGAKFCGWCLSLAPEDAIHAHVRRCGGDLYGTPTTFNAAHRPARAQRAADFVARSTALQPWQRGGGAAAAPAFDVTLRLALMAAAAPELAAYGIELYETPDGGVSYRLLADDVAGAADADASPFLGFRARPDAEMGRDQNAGGPGGDDGAPGRGAPGGCAAAAAAAEGGAAAWQRVAGPRTPLARLGDADVNVMRGLIQPRPAAREGEAFAFQRPGEGPATPAPATPEAAAARAAYSAAAARRREPPPRRSPLSMLR